MSQRNKKSAALGTDSPVSSKNNASQVRSAGKGHHSSSSKKDSSKRYRKSSKKSDSSSSSSSSGSGSGSGSRSSASDSGSASESDSGVVASQQSIVKSRAKATSSPSANTTTITDSNTKPVSAAQSNLSERIPWSEAEFTINIDGSLNSIKSNANDNGHLVLLLGQGLSADKITPQLRDKITSNLKLHSKSDLLKDPAKLRSNTHVIHDVVMEGSHNSFPSTLRIEMPSFVASSNDTCYVNSQGQHVNHLSFTLMPGETRSNKVLMKNVCSRESLDVYSKYQKRNPDNLREGVHKTLSKDGIAQVIVPHSKDERHPVVDLARSKMAKEDKLSKKQLKTYQQTGNLPETLMSESRDHPDHVIMSEAIFNEYHDRVVNGMRSSTPISDVAHPYALVSRVGGDELQYADGIASANRMENKKDVWTSTREIYANRSSAEAKKNVVDTDHKAWVRIKVRFAETKNLSMGLTE